MGTVLQEYMPSTNETKKCLTVRHISGQQKKAAFTIIERGNGLFQ